MLQPNLPSDKIITLLPSMFRVRSSVTSSEGERGRVLLFTGVRYERRIEPTVSDGGADADLPRSDEAEPS
jgi:hypothetical protein